MIELRGDVALPVSAANNFVMLIRTGVKHQIIPAKIEYTPRTHLVQVMPVNAMPVGVTIKVVMRFDMLRRITSESLPENLLTLPNSFTYKVALPPPSQSSSSSTPPPPRLPPSSIVKRTQPSGMVDTPHVAKKQKTLLEETLDALAAVARLPVDEKRLLVITKFDTGHGDTFLLLLKKPFTRANLFEAICKNPHVNLKEDFDTERIKQVYYILSDDYMLPLQYDADVGSLMSDDRIYVEISSTTPQVVTQVLTFEQRLEKKKEDAGKRGDFIEISDSEFDVEAFKKRARTIDIKDER